MRRIWCRTRFCGCGTTRPNTAAVRRICRWFSRRSVSADSITIAARSRRRKREESIIYLNDFQDVWLDPVLEEDEEALILRDAVQNLSQKLREVVVMKFWGGLTFLQISETLAISPNTAASRYRYALEQLAHELRRIKEVRHAQA